MRYFLFYLGFLMLILTNCRLYANDTAVDNRKTGGICFRIDDNHKPQQWRDIAKVFDKHGKPFCASLNLGRIVNDKEFVALIKDLQASGHEVLDHSPLHIVVYFDFAPGKNAKDYEELPGVDHISGNRVYLSYLPFTELPRYCKAVKATIKKNKLTVDSELEDKFYNQMKWQGGFLAFADKKVIYSIKMDKDTKNAGVVLSLWGEDNVDLDFSGEVWIGSQTFVHMTTEAHVLLGQNALDLFASIGAQRPYTWIQPGGVVSCLSAAEAKKSFGDKLGYKSAACYFGTGKKMFNEYDPDEEKRFGMQWGDFNDEAKDLEWNKTMIADRVALHHVLIGHSHMSSRLGGWDGYMKRLDGIVRWCIKEGIPIHTQSQWADILYGSKQDPDVDVFPSFSTDRDGNGRPDGFIYKQGAIRKGAGAEGAIAMVSDKAGDIFAIEKLGGLEHGKNQLSFIAKGNAGGALDIQTVFQRSRFRRNKKSLSYEFKGDDWEEVKFTLDVPDDTDFADISFSYKGTGSVFIGQPSLHP